MILISKYIQVFIVSVLSGNSLKCYGEDFKVDEFMDNLIFYFFYLSPNFLD